MIALLQGMFARILSESPGPQGVLSSEALSHMAAARITSSTAPYRIINRTGVPIQVWSDKQHPGGSPRSDIENEGFIPWRFDSWRSLRENVNIDTEGNLLNFKLKDTPFNNIERVPVNMEAQRPYRLKPAETQVPHHVLCEVKLGQDNVKEVIVRSTYLIENASLNEIELVMLHDGGRTQVRIEPGDNFAVPVLLAQSCRIQIRPPQGYGYDWSDEPFIWHDFLKRGPTRTIRSRSHAAASFNLIAHAIINKSTPLASRYPFMRVRISTPLKIVNLLPHDIKYNLYDKKLQEKFVNTVPVGDSSPVHSVELSHLLLMAVEISGGGYEGSEYSVINSDDPREFRREGRLNFRDRRGGRLHLGLHYLYNPLIVG
jgi:vacuolar protein sorting-associated protein 13A/C